MADDLNPSDVRELLRTTQQAFSGYVHGAYPTLWSFSVETRRASIRPECSGAGRAFCHRHAAVYRESESRLLSTQSKARSEPFDDSSPEPEIEYPRRSAYRIEKREKYLRH